MPNQTVEQRTNIWARAIGTRQEQSPQHELHEALSAAQVHSNEVRLVQTLVRARQQRVEEENATVDDDKPPVVTEAAWQGFLGRWQAADNTHHIAVIPPERAPQSVIKQIGTNNRWAANQRWFALAAGLGALVFGLQLTHFLRPPDQPLEYDVVMRGDEQAQRMAVADASVAKAKADEAERLLRDAGILVRRIEISEGARIEAKITANDLKRQVGLGEKLKQMGVAVPEHGRVVVEWMGK